jgi:hypothetical protein
MKKLLFILLTLLTVTVSAQQTVIYVDVPYSRMKERLNDDDAYIEKEDFYKGQRVVHVRSRKYGEDLLALLFYKGEECTNQGILMYDLGIVNNQVKIYNEVFVVLSKDRWRAYTKGKSFLCELKTLELDNTFYFNWVPEN